MQTWSELEPAVTIETLLAEVAALRAELAATRVELARVTAENATLRAENATLRAENAELRARLGMDSSNSSRPPSSDPPWNVKRRPPKPPTGRKPGGQPGHPPHRRVLLPPTEVFDVTAPECVHCGRDLDVQTVIGDSGDVHQVVDVEIRPVVHEYHLMLHKCPHCRGKTKAWLPRGVPKVCTGPTLQLFK